MSKRNRYKFRERSRSENFVQPQQSHQVTHSPSPAPARSDAHAGHAAEYRIIRKDMIRLVALNGFMLAAVIILFYTNKSSGYLERLFERIF